MKYLKSIITLLITKRSNQIDEFDRIFGFIKKHNIDSKSNYEKVKSHYSHNHEACQQ
jgi:hypothetical protein